MELQQGLNNVIRERIAKRIQTGSMNAQEAVQRLISEGKVANDYIAYLGAANTRKSQVLFDAADAVEMQLDKNGVYTIHDNAIGQLGERLNVPAKYLRELANGDVWQRELAATILNQHSTWTKRTRTLVRTVGNEVRGVLSDSYRRLNSETIIMSFLETANKPDDGVTGESTLWKLVQGITAHSRELEPRRQRDLQEIAGDLMNRVKL